VMLIEPSASGFAIVAPSGAATRANQPIAHTGRRSTIPYQEPFVGRQDPYPMLLNRGPVSSP
jgi:hypothetical protein